MFLDDKPSLYGISLCLKQLSQEAAQLEQRELANVLRDAALMADGSIAQDQGGSSAVEPAASRDEGDEG